jgi:hypothetical protein
VFSRRVLALIFICVIAAAVSGAATYPRWHTPAAPATLAAATAPAALPPQQASSVLPSLRPTPAPLSWAKLSVAQRTALAPFGSEWDEFSDARKRKWLKIAAQYPKMSLDEQDRLHQRMTQWVGMTADQRRTARENFQLSKAVPPQQREKAWVAYQQLPEDQKKKLAATGRRNHRPTVVSTPLTGKKELKDLNPAHRPDPLKPALASASAGTPTGSSAATPVPAKPGAASEHTVPHALGASTPGQLRAAPAASSWFNERAEQ